MLHIFFLHKGDIKLFYSLDNIHPAEEADSISKGHGNQSSNFRSKNGKYHVGLR